MAAEPVQQIDPRIVQTKASLKSALERLVKTNDPSKISVSALCKEAGVSRPTFYQHYSSVFDLYGEALKEKITQLEPNLFGAGFRDTEPLQALTIVIEYLDDNRSDLLSILDTNVMRFGAGILVRGWIDERLAAGYFDARLEDLDPEQADRITFTTNGVLGLVFKRLREENTTSAADLAARISRLAKASMLGE